METTLLERRLPVLRRRNAGVFTNHDLQMDFDPTRGADESRRTFLEHCALGLKAAALGSVLAPLASCGTPRVATRDLGDNRIEASIAYLVADGMSQVLDRKGPDGKGIVVVRQSADSYIAMSMYCTHKGCEVAPPDDDGIMVCPCHDSRFDLSGAVTKAPAKTPLKRYETLHNADARLVVITLA